MGEGLRQTVLRMWRALLHLPRRSTSLHVGRIWWQSKVEEGYSSAIWESHWGPLCLGTLLLLQSL